MLMEKIKSDEEGKKKQCKGLLAKADYMWFGNSRRRLKIWLAQGFRISTRFTEKYHPDPLPLASFTIPSSFHPRHCKGHGKPKNR
jgi:hypothetical protein